MGQVVSRFRKCFSPPTDRLLPKNTFLQILVIGDRGVGKSTLIDNFIKDADEISDAVETTDTNTERIRVINAQMILKGDQGETHNVSMTFIDINGELDVINRQIRDGYYKNSPLIFIIYNIAKVESLHHAKSVWQEELNKSLSKNSKNDTQLVLVGVNPESRDKYQESEVYQPGDDDHNETLFKKNTKNKSINRDVARKVASNLKYRNSTKKTKHYEVKTQRADIKQFFRDIIADYVFRNENDTAS